MRFRSRALVTSCLALALMGLGVLPALAAETANSEFVIIREDDVLGDDLYAGAIRVVVEGTIDGDLMAFAGEAVVINGLVTGSVFAVAPTVTINGAVNGSVRASATTVAIDGIVGRDVVSAAVNANFSTGSRVGGDVIVWGWGVEALGFIGRDLGGSMRSLDLAGTVEGDVEVSVGSLTVVDDLRVGGDLGYRSAQEAEGLELADVEGAIVNETPLPPNIRVRALSLLGRFMVVLFLTVAALAVAYGWPERTERAVAAVGTRPGRSWGIGAAVFLTPLAAALAGSVVFALAPAGAAFPLLLILAPLVLALFGVAFAVAFVAGVPAIGWAGGVLFKRLDLYGSILVGGLLAGIIWYLPLIGLLVPVIVLPLGLGAWIVSRRQETATVG